MIEVQSLITVDLSFVARLNTFSTHLFVEVLQPLPRKTSCSLPRQISYTPKAGARTLADLLSVELRPCFFFSFL